MRSWKPFSQSRITHQATGQAMRLAITTGFENCQTSSRTMSRVRAPNTFLMPISLVRRSAVKAASAEQAEAADDDRQQGGGGEDWPRASSASYSSATMSSTNSASNGTSGAMPPPDLLDAGDDRLRRLAGEADHEAAVAAARSYNEQDRLHLVAHRADSWTSATTPTT